MARGRIVRKGGTRRENYFRTNREICTYDLLNKLDRTTTNPDGYNSRLREKGSRIGCNNLEDWTQTYTYLVEVTKDGLQKRLTYVKCGYVVD